VTEAKRSESEGARLIAGGGSATNGVLRVALSREEAAQALGVHVNTLDGLRKRGLIRPSVATRRPLYGIEELERFMRETTEEI
jgi:hypothetical protein